MKPDNHGKAGPIYLVQNVYLLTILLGISVIK